MFGAASEIEPELPVEGLAAESTPPLAARLNCRVSMMPSPAMVMLLLASSTTLVPLVIMLALPPLPITMSEGSM